MIAFEDFIDGVILSLHKAIRTYVVFAVSLILVGLIFILVCQFLIPYSQQSPLNILLTVAGACASSVSAFPIKELLARKERINTIEAVKRMLPTANQSEKDRLTEMLMKTIEKSLTG